MTDDDKEALAWVNDALLSLDGLVTDNPCAQKEIRRAAHCLQAAAVALQASE